MAKEVSTGIRAFVKDSLNQYYKRFLVKLDDNPSKNSNKSAIKIHNDGSIYVYDIGNYTGSIFDDASTLLEVIKSIGQGHGTRVEAGDNIQVDSTETTSTISALGYTYNKNTSSFVEGYDSEARGTWAHAEGRQTFALGSCGHAEGYKSKSLNRASHAEGESTLASNNYSHAEGYYTITRNEAEHAEGKYNQSHENQTIHSIGVGSNDLNRKNAFEVMQDGSIYVYGLGNYDGSTLTNASTLLDICKAVPKAISNAGYGVTVDEDGTVNIGCTYAVIGIGGSEAEINSGNIDNLIRALDNTEEPSLGSNKLSTSGQIKEQLDKKENSVVELELQYGVLVLEQQFPDSWGLMNVSGKTTFFTNISTNTPIPIKFKCTKQHGLAVEDLETHDLETHVFYVYGSILTNIITDTTTAITASTMQIYIYINNAVYRGDLATKIYPTTRWIFLPTAVLTKLEEDPFF